MDTEIGPTLREARIRRKIDLAEVEQRTKIRVRYLRALENEEWDVLPGPAYTRGFIRTYANLLGLDGERLADDFRQLDEQAGAEPFPRSEPGVTAPRPGGRGQGARIGAGAAAALISVVLIAVLVVLGLTGGSDDEPGSDRGVRSAQDKQSKPQTQKPARGKRKVSLNLTAAADVWVCVLDASGSELVDGQILPAGAQEGPFRSGRFDVAFGNGAVSMQVNGEDFEVPESASPLGFRVARGEVQPLAESDRPDCQ